MLQSWAKVREKNQAMEKCIQVLCNISIRKAQSTTHIHRQNENSKDKALMVCVCVSVSVYACLCWCAFSHFHQLYINQFYHSRCAKGKAILEDNGGAGEGKRE
jgi:hypothetical protein